MPESFFLDLGDGLIAPIAPITGPVAGFDSPFEALRGAKIGTQFRIELTDEPRKRLYLTLTEIEDM